MTTKKSFKKPKLMSKFHFDPKTARRMMDMRYYQALSSYLKNYKYIVREKKKLTTPNWDYVTEILQAYKDLALTGQKSSLGKALKGLYIKNKQAVMEGKSIKNHNLLSLIAKPEMILHAYRVIRGNKGALTPGGLRQLGQVKLMTPKQRELYHKTNVFPDGFSMYDVLLTSELLKKGMYPWGTSNRIYFDKPGVKDKKRPITIPPFMDRVIQKTIEIVLQCIYEPVFEKLNRSFGFRPNKSPHDAITMLTNKYITGGISTAIEGDVTAAYDCVVKGILLQTLQKRIQDSKFFHMMKQRLDYDYEEYQTGKRFRPKLGIPQGGFPTAPSAPLPPAQVKGSKGRRKVWCQEFIKAFTFQ